MVNSGRDNTGKVEESTEKFKIWIEDLYMKGDAPYGSIYVELKESDSEHPYMKSDVKISDQNISSLVNNIQEAEKLEESEGDKLAQKLLQLKYPAKQEALKEASSSNYEEEKEELDVEEEKIIDVIESSYLAELVDRTDDAHVGDETLKTLSSISAFSKNLTDMALNLWSIGSSGSGKTHCYQTVFKTIPDEYKIKFNSCSPKALYYFVKKHGEDKLQGKVLLFNEAEASDDAIEVLRSVTDPNEENPSLLTVVDQKSTEISIQGSPVTWFTSVDPLDDGQLQNRFLFSNPEEGSEHKQDIADFQMKNFQKGVLQPEKEVDFPALKAGYRKIVEETRDLKVVVPFEWEWNRADNARLQTYFANLLFNIAKIHYKNHPILEDTVIVTLDDYFLAKLIWNRIEEITLDKVKQKDLELLEHMPTDDWITRSELQEETDTGSSSIRHATNRLRDAGLIRGEKQGDNDNSPWGFQKIGDNKLAQPASKLKTDSLESNQVEKVLEENNIARTEPRQGEGVRSQVIHLTPSIWKDFVRAYSIDLEEFKEVIEEEETVISDFASYASINEFFKDELDGERGSLNYRGSFIEAMQDLDAGPRGQPVKYDNIRKHGELKDFQEGKIEQVINQMLNDGELQEPVAGKIQLTEDAPA